MSHGDENFFVLEGTGTLLIFLTCFMPPFSFLKASLCMCCTWPASNSGPKQLVDNCRVKQQLVQGETAKFSRLNCIHLQRLHHRGTACTSSLWSYSTVLYCTLLYSSILYCTVLNCSILFSSIVLYCTVLYCIVLYSVL